MLIFDIQTLCINHTIENTKNNATIASEVKNCNPFLFYNPIVSIDCPSCYFLIVVVQIKLIPTDQ